MVVLDDNRSRVAPALLESEGEMTTLITNQDNDGRLTRRSIFMGAAASVICAPVVIGMKSLEPIFKLTVPEKLPYYGWICRLRFKFLESALLRGWDDKRDGRTFGGQSQASAMNSVVYARKHGLLPKRG